jgi:uncharacterized protein YjiS (DUF1127 family)
MEQRPIEARAIRVSPFLASQAEIERHLADARALRARAVADTVIAADPTTDALLHALGTRLAQWGRRQQTRDALMQCSDRVLADIGIRRSDVPATARGRRPAPI